NNEKTFKGSQIDAEKNTFNLANPAFTGSDAASFSTLGQTFELGQAVVYKKSDAATPDIPGLVHGNTYYIISAIDQFDLQGDNRFATNQIVQLAETEHEARAGVAIDIGAPPIGVPQSVDEYTFSAKHVLDSGFVTGVGVIAQLDAEDIATAGSGTQMEDPDPSTIDVIKEKLNTNIPNLVIQTLIKNYKDNASKANAGANTNIPEFNFSAGLAFSSAEHTVLTTVGGTAELKSNEDLEVLATIEQRFQIHSESTTTAPENGSTFSVAADVGLYTNIAKATVASGAKLDALKALRVISSVEYPYLTSPDEFAPTTLGESIDSLQNDGYDSLNKYMDGTLGIQGGLFNSWARSTAKADSVGVAGSINVLIHNNVAETLVQSGALLNQDTNWRDAAMNPHPNQGANQSDGLAEQTVSIEALNYMQTFNIAGIFGIEIPHVSTNPFNPSYGPKSVVKPLGTSSQRGGAGGAIFIGILNNTTTARVEDEVAIFSGDDGGFNIKAEELIFNVVLGQAGGRGGKIGVSGTVLYTEQNSNTLAQMSDQAVVTGRNVNIYAAGFGNHIAWAGGIATGEALGFGIAVAVNKLDRSTRAVIGDPNVIATANDPRDATSIDVTEDVNVRAAVGGSQWSFTMAGASNSLEPDTPEMPTQVPGRAKKVLGDADAIPPKTGVGLAAAVALSDVSDLTQASIVNAGRVQADTVSVTAEDSVFHVSATGGAAIVAGMATETTASLAGAFSLNTITSNTFASIIDTEI
ncbi:MAG: hypothetical protein KDA84_26425, partial [Planctomycetaceae bacterium]|nr:hypothetical protein [Planctomycetaceae bacterium]